MIVARTLEEFEHAVPRSCVTIGNFDGVHMGHRKLISRTHEKALANDLASVVVTFDPHPLRVLRGKTPPFITMTQQKLELIANIGPHATLLLEFSREMAALSPQEFVSQYLVHGLGMEHMVIGYDYHMGRGREGNYETLARLGEKMGFSVERLAPVELDDDIVSSTRIRTLVEEGRVWDAHRLLGRFYQVRGEVVHGMKRGGDLLGFPTANLKLVDELHPMRGVYAIWVEVDGEVHPGVANIGFNPTFGNDALSVEAHIMDFSGDIYGKEILVHFVRRIRDEKKFNGIDELRAQIDKDTKTGREILTRPEARAIVTSYHSINKVG